MLEHLAARSHSGDLLISLAKSHLADNEWGMARISIERAISRGNLSDYPQALSLLEEVNQRLGIRP